jgi:hypothetical protein
VLLRKTLRNKTEKIFYCLSGFPTAIEQSCPGWPCAGFKRTSLPLLSVVSGTCEEFDFTVVLFNNGGTGLVDLFSVFTCEGESSGAPTAISHLCPGCPCDGFSLAEVAEVLVVMTGLLGSGVLVAVFFTGAEFKGAPTAISQR